MGAKRRCHAPGAPCGSVHHVSAGVGEEGRRRAQKGGGGGIGGSVGDQGMRAYERAFVNFIYMGTL